MSNTERKIWIFGATLMALAIILGAFGAHALRSSVGEDALRWWDTGATYHRIHALGLMFVATLYPRVNPSAQKLLRITTWLMMIGLVFFSGSLYLMTLTGLRVLGAITPVGGTLWIISWILCVLALTQSTSTKNIN